MPSNILRLLSQYEIIQSPLSQIKTERIYAGTINHNYKIIDGDSRFLLKLFTENKRLPIDRKRIFSLQEELAILSLAPQPFFLSEDNQIYCEQWIDYQPLTVNDNLDKLAEALNYVHTTYISAPHISLLDHWKEYWCKSSLTKRHQITTKLYESMQEKWAQYHRQFSEEFVLCHNDLHITHVCDKEGPFLDWEYSGLGCRYFDIASCCIINQLDPYQTNVLCKNYALVAGLEPNNVIERVSQASEFVSFTNKLWIKALNVGDDNNFTET